MVIISIIHHVNLSFTPFLIVCINKHGLQLHRTSRCPVSKSA